MKAIRGGIRRRRLEPPAPAIDRTFVVAAGSRPTNPPRRTACTCTSPGQPPGCSPIAVFGTSPNLNTIQLEASGGPGAGTGAIGPNNSVTITSEDNLHQINGTTT